MAPKRALRAVTTAPATDVDKLAAMLFAVCQPVRRADLLETSGWTPPRLQAAADALVAAPPRGLQVLVDRDRVELVSAPAGSKIVGRLLRRLERGEVIEPLDLLELPRQFRFGGYESCEGDQVAARDSAANLQTPFNSSGSSDRR